MKRILAGCIALYSLWLAGCSPESGAGGTAAGTPWGVAAGKGQSSGSDWVRAAALRKASRLSGQAAGMSASGQLAAAAIARGSAAQGVVPRPTDEQCVNTPDCEDEDSGFTLEASPSGTRAEVALATDATGQHIVIGFNDSRGFRVTPVSVSGFMYSDDGGKTFTDGGQLPSLRSAVVYGDPDVKYLGACTFIYSSILIVEKTIAMKTVQIQSMGLHRSTDCGHTWQGPFEITGATDENGAADKEFMDVDPDTGRVLVSWTDFADTGTEMSVTYSDDALTATPPTWSARKAISVTAADGQGSVPRFAGNGSKNVYVTWTRFPRPGKYNGLGDQIAFARSTDNGATWSTPTTLGTEFFSMDYVLGNDRVHNFSSLAVDNSAGRNKGAIYVVYADNDNRDGSDVYVQRSTDQGVTFSAPLNLSSRPGSDRAQWFPYVTVDKTTGRVYVFFLDQGIADSGDLTECSFTYSDDGGVTFSAPAPLSLRPFHAGWGNDNSQPNLGDYIGGTAQGGELFSVFAATHRPQDGFVDGQPGTQLGVPEPQFRRTSGGSETSSVPLSLAGVRYVETGGNRNIDPGDQVSLRFGIRNYVTNPLNGANLYNILGRVSTRTPGVRVLTSTASFGHIAAGDSGSNSRDFVLQIDPSFVPGTPIELELFVVASLRGSATLRHTLFTGTPQATTLLSENFDAVTAGKLPAGWVAQHSAGANTVPWTTKSGFCGATSNTAFHADAIDGPTGGDPTRWEGLWTPMITIPAKSDYVEVDFDVCYNTEDDPNYRVLGYDGFFLRISDLTKGRTARTVLVEAFADDFTTGSFYHYPKHLPRGGGSYFSDMSAWSGDSQGMRHVHLRLPGMAASTVQLRFEYTQDGAASCTDAGHSGDCGVAMDNLVVRNVVAVKP